MTTVVSRSHARSAWLTGAAGLLLLVTAVVMMVCAAPRIHAARHPSVTHQQLASWIWVTPDHWIRVTPATVGEFIRAGRGPVP